MRRLACLVMIAAVSASVPAAAQQAIPPAAPTMGASGGVGGGIALPVGRLSDTHTAGYTLSGLVDFSAADQPYSFRAELIYQRYDHKTTGAGAAERNKNILSIGGSLLARRARQTASTYVVGGIAVYRPTDEGTKPGVNVGAGMEVPLTYFVGLADIRLHYVLTESKPLLTIPITLGVRF